MTEENKTILQILMEYLYSTREEIKAREAKRAREEKKKKFSVIKGGKK